MRVFLYWSTQKQAYLLSESMTLAEVEAFCRKFAFDQIVEVSQARKDRGSIDVGQPLIRAITRANPDSGVTPPEGIRFGVLSWDIVLEDNAAAVLIDILHLEDGE